MAHKDLLKTNQSSECDFHKFGVRSVCNTNVMYDVCEMRFTVLAAAVYCLASVLFLWQVWNAITPRKFMF